ncbi:MAG: LptF/LptG family permease [Sporichthyaceae bacterium]
MRFSLMISRYLIGAVLPYFIFSWLLLSVILFVQQAARFGDIFFSANLPANLVWQLTLALVPNVVAFTAPMAALVGVIIGLSKMQSDNELVAIRASGVGNFQITLPIFILGCVLSILAFVINLYGVPLAARIVRQVAIQTAIYKLESPIEPGVFNTEIAGYTIFVKDGDLANGQWKNIFVHNEDEKTGTVRMITSQKGRIDSSGELSELVLENAVATTFNRQPGQQKFVSERIGDVRFAIQTRRGELIQKLSSADLTPEELGLSQLSDYANQKDGSERTEAQILWQRRIVLSITPIIFCLLGTSLILRFHRQGRGFGIVIALACLIVYYLLAFLGEQLARTDRISVLQGSLIPILLSVLLMFWFNFSSRVPVFEKIVGLVKDMFRNVDLTFTRRRRSNVFLDITTGLRDFDIVVTIVKYYLLTLGFLAAVFMIFTAFELWKFAGKTEGGIVLLFKYLFYLIPFIYIQLAPSAAMVATLATYVIKSRQNEIITWTSAGLSVYRLLLPCIVLMMALGFVNWQLQERVAPGANLRQDELRSQIRSHGVALSKSGKFWVANDRRIYSFEFDQTKSGLNNIAASDNAPSSVGGCAALCAVQNLTIYEFDSVERNLQTLYQAESAIWDSGGIHFSGPVERTVFKDGRLSTEVFSGGDLEEGSNPFGEVRKKPSHLTTSETRAHLESSESEVERRSFAVALDKKYVTAFLPFVIALFTAPFALSLSRKGKVLTIGYAVGLWLLFMAITSAFEQLGLNGSLPSGLAIWGPLVLFSILGIFLLSKVKT